MKVSDGGKPWELETVWYFRTYGPIQAARALNSVDGLSVVATYNYDYDIGSTSRPYDARLDRVYVLKKM